MLLKKRPLNENTKKIQVGEPSIAFLEKMPKCESNKNQKIIKIMYIPFLFHVIYI